MWRLLAIVGFMAAGASHLLGAPSEVGDSATIINSGATNRPGFRIVVDRSGAAEFTSVPRRSSAPPARPASIRQTLPHMLVETFYADLRAAKRLDSLPAVHCAKSASFGSILTVAFGQDKTPDLSCGDGGNAVMRDLIRDTRQIVSLMQTMEATSENGIR
ncbi:MAG: hypothetical protein ABSA80_21220 [Terriglobales bacterium]|jgi:hypothetical protein